MTADGAGARRAVCRSSTPQLSVLVAVRLPRRPLEGSTTSRGSLPGAELVWFVEYLGDDDDGDRREVLGVEADVDAVVATVGRAVDVSVEKPRSQLG